VADDRVIGPGTSNTDPTVHVTSADQTINFSIRGRNWPDCSACLQLFCAP